MSIFDSYQSRYESFLEEEYSLQEYLKLCKEDPSVYASAAESFFKKRTQKTDEDDIKK